MKYEHNDCDAPESDVTSTQITLTDRFGKINKRKQQAVIKFRKYNKENDPSNWYRAKLMLYYPWFDEQADLYATYEEHHRHVGTIVPTNESKYTKADIHDIEVDEDGPPEHLWNSIAPSTVESRMQSMAEGSEQLTEISQQDLRDNEFLSGPGGVGKSHVIKLVHSDTLKLLKLSGTFEPDDLIVLLTAPTGVTAFNINGMTLHSAFLLGRSKYSGFQPLSLDRLNTLQTKLSRLLLTK